MALKTAPMPKEYLPSEWRVLLDHLVVSDWFRPINFDGKFCTTVSVCEVYTTKFPLVGWRACHAASNAVVSGVDLTNNPNPKQHQALLEAKKESGRLSISDLLERSIGNGLFFISRKSEKLDDYIDQDTVRNEGMKKARLSARRDVINAQKQNALHKKASVDQVAGYYHLPISKFRIDGLR